MDTRDKMTREISKAASFAISGLSEVLTLQMDVFMQPVEGKKQSTRTKLILYYLIEIMYHCILNKKLLFVSEILEKTGRTNL